MATYYITDAFLVGGVGQNGLTVNAYAESRFTSPPAKNGAAPDGNPADATATTGSTYGNDGSFQLTLSAVGGYWVSVTYSGTTYWKRYEVGGRVLYGAGVPAGSVGAIGDSYVDESTGNVYGPKANVIPTALDLVGTSPLAAAGASSGPTSGTTTITTVHPNELLVVAVFDWQVFGATCTVDGTALTAKTTGGTTAGNTVSYYDVILASAGSHTIAWTAGTNSYGLAGMAYATFTGLTIPSTPVYSPAGSTASASMNASGDAIVAFEFSGSSYPPVPTSPGGTFTSIQSAVYGNESYFRQSWTAAGMTGNNPIAVTGTSSTAEAIAAGAYQMSAAWPLAASNPAPKGLKWTATKTAAYTASAGDAVPCDTTSATFAVTTPATPAADAPLRVKWKAGTTAPTIAANTGQTIDSTWGGFGTVGDVVDFTFNANTSVWEVV